MMSIENELRLLNKKVKDQGIIDEESETIDNVVDAFTEFLSKQKLKYKISTDFMYDHDGISEVYSISVAWIQAGEVELIVFRDEVRKD